MSNINNEKEPPILATLTKVVKGKHGFYAVAFSSSVEGTITFSLELLEEKIDLTPQVLEQLKGVHVVLSNIVKKQKGWRALKARFYKPSDKEVFASETSEKQQVEERRSDGH